MTIMMIIPTIMAIRDITMALITTLGTMAHTLTDLTTTPIFRQGLLLRGTVN